MTYVSTEMDSSSHSSSELSLRYCLKDTVAPHEVKQIREKNVQSSLSCMSLTVKGSPPVRQMRNPGLIASITMTGKPFRKIKKLNLALSMNEAV